MRTRLAVYKEFNAGDQRKRRTESADTKSGGGARDLRFPWTQFEPAMSRIFTTASATAGVRTTQVTAALEGSFSTSTLEYWRPTLARPNEGRIARIHLSPDIGGRTVRVDRGRILVLLRKDEDESVWCSYVYELDLRTGLWPSELSAPLLAALEKTQVGDAKGYLDFENGVEYVHESVSQRS